MLIQLEMALIGFEVAKSGPLKSVTIHDLSLLRALSFFASASFSSLHNREQKLFGLCSFFHAHMSSASP